MSDFNFANEDFVNGEVFVVVSDEGFGYAMAVAESFDFVQKVSFRR